MRNLASRFLRNATIALGGVCALALSTQGHAQALVLPGASPVAVNGVGRCASAAPALLPTNSYSPTSSKAQALLGGKPSALDAIRAQQAGLADTSAIAGPVLAVTGITHFDLSPAVGSIGSNEEECQGFVAHGSPMLGGLDSNLAILRADPENFLASRRIRIGKTNFDADWDRVSHEKLSRSTFRRYLGTPSGNREGILEQVNTWVNHRVTYTEDRQQYGQADYWAGARKTLRSGRGDCEDIALTKMQLLAAAGVPRSDMILTIARDLVRNADHAILIVREGNGYVMLDNATDKVLDAAPQNDYRAILSFGSKETWLHGA